MNIVLINHYAGSKKHGMEYRPFYLGREWVRRNHHVTIVAASYSHVRREQPPIAGRVTLERIEGIQYVWLKTSPYQGNGYARAVNMFRFVWRLLDYSKTLVREAEPDIVIASSTYPMDIYPARLLARKSKAKLVYEVHDLWPLSLTEAGGMPGMHPFILLTQHAENYAYRHADLVVSLLPKAEEHMREHGLTSGKFVHIPNGIDISEWGHSDTDLPPEHKDTLQKLKQAGRFIVGYAGAHGLVNGLDSFIQAARLLQELPVTFVLVGHGPEKQRLQDIVREKEIRNVVFLAPVTHSLMSALLELMDVVYIGLKSGPVFRFGVSPNKLMDYMMAARPVIYAIESGNDMVAESGCGISIPSESPKAISKAVGQLMSLNPAERSALGLKGRDYIKANHDYRVLAHRFLDFLGAGTTN